MQQWVLAGDCGGLFEGGATRARLNKDGYYYPVLEWVVLAAAVSARLEAGAIIVWMDISHFTAHALLLLNK